MLKRNDIHVIGAFVHGVLCSFHCLGVLYNYKRNNKYQATVHLGVACYDLWAFNHHFQEAKNGSYPHAVP